jgi:peroxiredoxin
MAPDLTAKAIDGTAFQLSTAMKGQKAAVVAVTSSSCPLSKKYLPTLAKLEQDYVGKGVAFVLVDPIATDNPADLKELVQKAGLKAPVIHDADGKLCKALGATSTTDLFVLDAKRTVQYRGAIDDQYGLGYSTDAPKKTYAIDALTAVLAGKEPVVPATTAPGCELDLQTTKIDPVKVTYHNRISRIVQQNCQTCHRPGGVGPFALNTRDDVLAHKGMIKKVVTDGTMPPWNAVEPKGSQRTFKNDRSLPDADKADLLAWLAENGPEGDAADAPLPRTYPNEWAIGKPDLVVQIPEPINIPATGIMKYQNIIVEVKLDESKWVTAAEVQPTDKSVVHHVLVFALPPPLFGVELPRQGEAIGYFAAYVPGNSHQILPPGFARKFPKGWRIKFQIHYTPNGTATKDQTRVGFKFADAPPEHEIFVRPIAPRDPRSLSIPPGDGNYKQTVEWTPTDDVVVTAFSPHMHVRGKACRYDLGTKSEKPVLDIPHYDFNWQLRYEPAEPIRVAEGTPLKFTAWYDNSDKNPANPDPKRRVPWGPQTYDEMLIGFVEYYIPSKPVKKPAK